MRAMVLNAFGEKLALSDVPAPKPKNGEILLKMKAAGLCGTDLKIVDGKLNIITPPHIPGHEIAGEIVECGDGVSKEMLGKRIIAHTHHTCGICEFCRRGEFNMCRDIRGRLGFEMPGGLGEYLTMAAVNCVEIPDTISYTDACIVPCAMITPYNAIKRARIKVTDRVVMLGVGGLGVHGIQFLKFLGAHVTAVDIKPEKLVKARELGADVALSYDDFINNSERYSVIMDNVGIPKTTAACHKKLDKHGRFVQVAYAPGLEFTYEPYFMHVNEIEIIGLRNGTIPDLLEILQILSRNGIEPIVDRILPLEKANEALDLIRRGEAMGRVVVTHE